MNRNTVFNFVLFVVLAAAVVGGWWWVENTFFPKPPPPPPPAPKEVKPARESILAVAGGGVTTADDLADWPGHFKPVLPQPKLVRDEVLALASGGVAAVPEPKPQPKPARETMLAVAGGGVTRAADLWDWPNHFVQEDTNPRRLIALSGEGYNLRVLLTNRGAGVQQVALPEFDQASRVGTLAKENGKPYPLELVPGYERPRDTTSVKNDPPHVRLDATEPGKAVDSALERVLTEPSYTLLHYDAEPTGPAPRPSDVLATRNWQVVSERAGTADQPGEVVFETTLEEQHVRIRKTFTLAKNEFHVRMKLEFFATPGRPAKAPFHYQICGPRGLPIEGEWYSGVQHNAIIGCKTKDGAAKRAIADAAHITTEYGSDKYTPNSSEVPGAFTFAAVVNQFFAAALCVEPPQAGEAPQTPWAYVRATREGTPPDADKPQLGDITVRAVSVPIEPAADTPVEHRYWLYHGPTKVRLLNSLYLLDADHQGYSADRKTVDDQYIGAIGLNVITDAPNPGPMGWFTGTIGWTWLVVWFTNLMHDILGWLHLAVPNWGVNILMLTVMVRLVLMLPSRRQQASMMKMQEKMAAMKPELDKIQEKYKADPQRLNQEKTKLMLAHGVNPLSSMGGCLLMFAQMPIFLGLYYCLQESIFFRLDNFLWIQNLAAPDMLFTWTESIPLVSDPSNMGSKSMTGFLYLGPFLNLLPVVSVSLMYLNFKLSSPPPTDEQQAAQQRTMKFMMLFMGVFFYKMAAGLCLYFICSTLWGITERTLLKRKRKKMEAEAAANPPPPPTLNLNGAAKPNTPPKPPGFFERVKQGLLEKLEEAQKQAESQGQQIINKPKDPPPGGPPKPNGNQGGGKGKKKRKK